MKRILLFAFPLLATNLAVTQSPLTQPSLSTADKLAIQSCEKQKQEAQQAYGQAQQNETSVLREWDVVHPGWHINPVTFAPEKNPEPAVTTAAPKAAAPPTGKPTPDQKK